jgi:ABC-type glycerol-3-phosphate transport system substrate-binding protein
MVIKKVIALVTLFAIVTFSGFGCKGADSTYQVQLDVWGTFDNSNAYTESFDEYNKINPNISSVNYRKITLESYKEDLLSALAAGTGPDVFMIHNSWLPDFQDKIVPVSNTMINEQDFRNNFVDVVADDMIVDGKIYGVPLSVDSLALYYNKDIFNAAGITRPPRTWKEFDTAVQALTRIDEFGNITQSGATIGTSYSTNGAINVNRAPDILSLMMIQDGAQMSIADGNRVTFGEARSTEATSTAPGEKALEYYTSFASAGKPNYTWNKNQNYSIDEFFEGTAAMTINYSYHYDTIKAKNAKLNFAVADIPQNSFDPVGNQADFADYWVFVVAKNKAPMQSTDPKAVVITDAMRVHEAWQFLRAISFPSEKGVALTNVISGEALTYMPEFDLTEKYLEQTGKPAARRDLIEKQKTDVKLGAFARGNLIARTWWRYNADAVDGIFYDMIDRVNTGQMGVHESLMLGQQRIQQLQPLK